MPPGCLALFILLAFLFLVPFFFTHAMVTALSRLGLSPELAFLVLVGIFIGGLINIPVRRIEREREVDYDPFGVFGLERIFPRFGWTRPAPFRRTVRTYVVLAVNVGGCLIPAVLAVYEIFRVAAVGDRPFLVMAGVTALNIAVCYRIARPIPNVGIAMPAFIPPLVAVIPSVLLVPEFAPPVAFTAGVLGPLVGADLLHLRDIERLQTGIASIGGAGTFDGIVLSGMIAALLA